MNCLRKIILISKLLTAAREYAGLGWRVFPIFSVSQLGGCECGDPECTRAGKHPAIKKWPEAASVERETIDEWWKDKPDRGVGIATGRESGLTVLDVDGDEGVVTLGKLAGGIGIPPTPSVTTRPGRYHYYFSYKEGIKSQAGKIGPALDTRNDGGYVVAPPSRHASGGLYTWLQSPFKVPLADWPEFLDGKGKGGAGGEVRRGRPAKEQFNPANPKDVETLKAALEFIDADDEERWGMVGVILGRAFHQADSGFVVYQAWAARSRKYDGKRTKKHYYERSKEERKAGAGGLLTTSSIYKWANEGGWTPDNAEEREERAFNVFENPFREEKMIDEFIIAASASDSIFVMDKRMVRIVHYGSSGVADAEIERDPTAYVVFNHDTDTLAVELGNIAAFWAMRAKGYQRGGFSRAAIKTFLSYRKYGGIKPLDAFVSHPTLRANGTLITEVGYDAESRLFLTATIPGLKIEQRLTQKAARAAMVRLLEPFSEYPWASLVDRAVFCAALFTVGLRHLFDVAPLFAFSSPKFGSGKTQLAECISRLWYGVTLSKATWTPNPEEMEKRIASFLLAGDRIVCLDNVTEGMRLEDSTLNKVLTSRRNTFRLLGHTERVELTNEATWFATGNQLLLSGDISRRALICYVDAKVVDPSARSFTISNLPSYIMAHRAELLGAALSIATSWVNAGRPMVEVSHREYGSFTDWYALIRPMLMWVGEADVAAGLDAVAEEDVGSEALNHFANVLRRAMPPDNSRLSTPDIFKLFGKADGLTSALAGCGASHDREPNLYVIANVMRSCENKIFVSDNPGTQFTFTKKLDVASHIWRWGVEER